MLETFETIQCADCGIWEYVGDAHDDGENDVICADCEDRQTRQRAWEAGFVIIL